MSDDVRFERLLTDVLSDVAPTRVPDRLVPDILAAASHTRRRPRWLALATESPMRRRAEVLVGSPTVRLASPLLMAVLLALLAVAALVVGGIVRPPELAVVVVPSPSLPGVVAPSSTPSGPSAGPTASPVTNPAGIWIATGTMGTPRYDHTAVRLLDGRVLVLGGTGDGSDVTSAELYDPPSGTWSATGPMVGGGGTATLLRDGKVLVAGENGAQLYDPDSGTWSATGPMVGIVETQRGTATLLRDGKVLVAGHEGAQLYDPDSGTWTATGKMTTPRYYSTATLLPDGRVLVAGGFVVPDVVTDVAELYDPSTGSWTAIANMPARLRHHTATLLRDRKVLVAGGSGGPQFEMAVYDPATETWTVLPARPDIGYGAATLLSDGKLLLGYGADPPSAELYDPSTGSWTTAAPMLRSHGTPAISLLDGTVLVAGGNDCLDGVCVATGSAELYVPAGVSPPPLPAFPSPPPPVIPSPTPIPTPFPPAAGPIPPNARSWTVTVDNESSEPVTLSVAAADGLGPLQLVGSASPNVVPAGATVQVTFLFPVNGGRADGWICVDLRPGEEGGLVEADQIGIPGKILIREDGDTFWVGP